MIYILIWLLMGCIAGVIGSKKGEGFLSFIVGVIFGPFGILFAILSRGNRVKCPSCREFINNKAVVCPHCQRDVPAKT